MSDEMRRVRSGRESGQAAVESALVLPLMIFLCLGIIQLTMIEHAKIMTEYAAYSAARAGIVWNGNNERMHDAAIFALLPTIGRTDDIGHLLKTWVIAKLVDTGLSKLKLGGEGGAIPDTFALDNLFGLVRIDTVNPGYWTAIGNFWNLIGKTGDAGKLAANWQELDFDGPATYPEAPKLVKEIGNFLNLKVPDDQEKNYRRSTVLSIRVRYWYQMRIPFADWIIFVSWFAANAGRQLHGGIGRSTLKNSNMLNRSVTINPLGGMGKGIKHQHGFDSVHSWEMAILWGLANGSIPLLSKLVGKRYFIPLTATYSMRMQSNFYRKWVMHFKGTGGP